MTSIDTPRPIEMFLDATARGDSDAFVAAFTQDAYLEDWGRSFHGHDGVRDWDRTDNTGVQSHIELVTLTAGSGTDSYVGTVQVSGNGFNGTGTMTFTLRDDHISSLVVS
ncbi:nuclear transport factor 2 family protein [Occultella gossypii]|uniref:Nuclear transport factor 2 family protein n=1 Tax=Occultella gossypii TaxID=2800820 RepID=A0ABS7SB11_9MICO|nr:nuclear transport factor 2 family protein [Occultella gossypii]MBZ2197541.1 nuclear transport factor 2 family protein [Occultella gossypii]